ncbi:hypothetical protein [Halonatronum saccharophilum]|uniref:hypothetical protein n=1 Tax=Halonatronum saccharophilum TaxID=150060 RepID=UPI000482CE34|nr:hypothetical protein [Halonatronum saccharophilum]
MIEGITASLLATAVWEAGKKGVGLTKGFLKEKFGGKLNDDDYIEICEEINQIPRSERKSKKEIEELIKNNETILDIINNSQDNSTNINVKGDNNKIAGRDYIEKQTNIETQNNITNNGGQQTNNFIQNQKDDPKKS